MGDEAWSAWLRFGGEFRGVGKVEGWFGLGSLTCEGVGAQTGSVLAEVGGGL